MQIKKAAVMGAGVMGAQIAAHIANAGIPCLLLDIVPKELTPEEQAQAVRTFIQTYAGGVTEEQAKELALKSPAVRNRVAQAGLDAAKKAKPAAFFSPEIAELVSVGNFENDLPKLKDCDWIIEAVIENLEIKRSLFARVEPHLHPAAIISSNTSGIPIAALAAGRSDAFRRRFLGTHFFNPPRYLHLLEVIRTPDTSEGVLNLISDFCDRALGKGIVHAKDSPNFIANRIGTFAMLDGLRVMLEGGYTIEEVDALTGAVIGHAKSATFRTLDLVGLDTAVHVANNLYANTPADEKRETFRVPELLAQMVERRMLGDKTRGGFFKKAGDEILTLDLGTLEYRPRQKPMFASLEAAKNIERLDERLRALVYAKDRAGEFLWRTLSETLIYAANRVPEIADNIVEVDNAMKWGFAHELGVFETWDVIGVEKSVARLREEGRPVPANVERMLEAGHQSFYKSEKGTRYFYDFAKHEYRPERARPGVLILKSLKERERVVKKNAGASMIDLGDGVACVEFHSKMNAIGGDTIQMLNFAIKEVEKNFAGLVIGNEGENFSVGANIMLLLLEAQEDNWDEINLAVRAFQNTTMSLRYSAKPVVVAPFQMALGGGCELVLHADRAVAAAETYLGLVEVGVGLIPGGGGTKEMALRASEAVADTPEVDPFFFLKRNFENIALAKVSTSAVEAKHLGLMRSSDRVVANRDRLLEEAKQSVLARAREYRPPQPRQDVLVLGEQALTRFKLGIHMMKRGGYISEHDALVGTKIAEVMSGGQLTRPTRVSESYLLDLEREAFVSLCGTRQTQERIAHMLKTGKPLRN
jgi:3-hydroxyacyl-CoA dehydrogenase